MNGLNCWPSGFPHGGSGYVDLSGAKNGKKPDRGYTVELPATIVDDIKSAFDSMVNLIPFGPNPTVMKNLTGANGGGGGGCKSTIEVEMIGGGPGGADAYVEPEWLRRIPGIQGRALNWRELALLKKASLATSDPSSIDIERILAG